MTTIATPRFRPITLDDGPLLRRAVAAHGFQSCMFNFVHVYTRAPDYDFRIATVGEHLVLRNAALDWTYYPVGPHLDGAALAALVTTVGASELRFAPDDLAAGEFFEARSSDAEAEYVYDTAALATLAGLSRKREEARRFWRTYPEAEVRRLHAADADACMQLACAWRAHKPLDERIELELASLRRSLDAFDALGLDGIALTVSGRMVAYEVTSGGIGDMAACSFEKFDRSHPGCVAALRAAVAARLHAQGWSLMNFGRDLGLDSLRRSKRAYLPVSYLRPVTLSLRAV